MKVDWSSAIPKESAGDPRAREADTRPFGLAPSATIIRDRFQGGHEAAAQLARAPQPANRHHSDGRAVWAA